MEFDDCSYCLLWKFTAGERPETSILFAYKFVLRQMKFLFDIMHNQSESTFRILTGINCFVLLLLLDLRYQNFYDIL